MIYTTYPIYHIVMYNIYIYTPLYYTYIYIHINIYIYIYTNIDIISVLLVPSCIHHKAFFTSLQVTKLVRANKFVLDTVMYKVGEDAISDAFSRAADAADNTQVPCQLPPHH